MKRFRNRKPARRSSAERSVEEVMHDALRMIERADLKALAANPVSRKALQGAHSQAVQQVVEFRRGLALAEQIEQTYATALATAVEA
ncbi:hypothetical protein [Stenotrophomonas maltophilia]|uniref:hypothetical protein n=1 Tax=Stenotrophomonas maltophilia TaxID=40324 RepID=UPI0020985FD9|nr:hypothetical protein [Stenotrophomonas maltophilia]MCO7456454.1 hypothetical protein [Stenotrophomonas maltophilia]MCO7464876.1 hypothetical protein [Stenotrophomonas maltophilia]MCO7482053.1 hypothetical protein [Stenotrophomonas maltophilia]MCO7492701.1 hypothetical protein [Stenotrophomonas maltophilia]